MKNTNNENDYIVIKFNIENIKVYKKRLGKLIRAVLPVWMVIIIVANSMLLTGILEYYFLDKQFKEALVELSEESKSSDEFVQILKQEVIPQSGYTLAVRWDDIGKELMDSGVIDKNQYEEVFKNEPQVKEYMKYLEGTSREYLRIDEKNAHFMVNTLWALGLVNKSKILDEGSITSVGDANPMNYASTGGWNLGVKPTSELYSSTNIIELSEKQEALVKKIAETVYRPCCNNHTEFPDCNHGMAALGYIQLAVSQGVSEKRIYKDLLALSSYWFPQNYIELAAYMRDQEIKWSNVDSKLALSAEYSSIQGSQKVKFEVQDIPGLQSQGGGCSV